MSVPRYWQERTAISHGYKRGHLRFHVAPCNNLSLAAWWRAVEEGHCKSQIINKLMDGWEYLIEYWKLSNI